jgi:hypothetical protein
MRWGTQAKRRSSNEIVATKFVLQCVITKFPKKLLSIGRTMYYYPTNINLTNVDTFFGEKPRWLKKSTENS